MLYILPMLEQQQQQQQQQQPPPQQKQEPEQEQEVLQGTPVLISKIKDLDLAFFCKDHNLQRNIYCEDCFKLFCLNCMYTAAQRFIHLA